MSTRSRMVLWKSAMTVGGLWFGFFVFLAVTFFAMRGLADEPGYRMTAVRALFPCGILLVIGSPGLVLAWIARRNIRALRSRAAETRGFEVIEPQ